MSNLKNGVIRRVIDYEVGNDYYGKNYNHSEVMELKRKAFNNYGLFVDEWIGILSKNKKQLNLITNFIYNISFNF